MSGYDQFFKEAQKASGLIKGDKPGSKPQAKRPLKQPARSAVKASGKSAPRFKLQSETGGTPEDRMRAELASRMRQKKAHAIRKKKTFPIYPVACTIAALITCGIGYHQSDRLDAVIEKVTSKVDIGFMGQAHAEGSKSSAAKSEDEAEAKAEKSAASSTEKKVETAETKAQPSVPTASEAKSWTPEELSFFGKLNDRKIELDQREADLAKLEEELQKRKSELDEKLKELDATRVEISKALKSRVTSDQQKVAKLVDFYSTMKPQQAAKVIETLNEDLAVEVLDNMKKKNAAEVLNMMDAKKARRLSELLTGYQRTTASADPVQESSAPVASEGAASAE